MLAACPCARPVPPSVCLHNLKHHSSGGAWDRPSTCGHGGARSRRSATRPRSACMGLGVTFRLRKDAQDAGILKPARIIFYRGPTGLQAGPGLVAMGWLGHHGQRAQVAAPCGSHAAPVHARFCTESRAPCSTARSAVQRMRRVLQGLFSGGEVARGRNKQNRRRTRGRNRPGPDSGKFRSQAPVPPPRAGLRVRSAGLLQRRGRVGPTSQ